MGYVGVKLGHPLADPQEYASGWTLGAYRGVHWGVHQDGHWVPIEVPIGMSILWVIHWSTHQNGHWGAHWGVHWGSPQVVHRVTHCNPRHGAKPPWQADPGGWDNVGAQLSETLGVGAAPGTASAGKTTKINSKE